MTPAEVQFLQEHVMANDRLQVRRPLRSGQHRTYRPTDRFAPPPSTTCPEILNFRAFPTIASSISRRTYPPSEPTTRPNRVISAHQKICRPIVAFRRGNLSPPNPSLGVVGRPEASESADIDYSPHVLMYRCLNAPTAKRNDGALR
jgi:hypothetical protein